MKIVDVVTERFRYKTKRDAECCAAVREAVGPDFPLMLDCHHGYSREESRQLGKALERIGFYWIEE